MLTLSAGEIPVAGDAELKRFFAAYITKNLSDSKARTANFVSEGDNASQVMQPAHDTQDNNKPGRGSFFALLIVIGAVLTVSFVLVFLRPDSDPGTKPGQVLGFYIEGVLAPCEYGGVPNLAPPPGPNDSPESMGYPVPIRKDGTVSLPSIKPVYVQDKSLREIHELVSSAYQKVIPNQTTAIRICLFPERQHWKKETWDRIRFYDDLRDRLKRILGMSSPT